jgi:DNA-binding GntR family transcriptional regulator
MKKRRADTAESRSAIAYHTIKSAIVTNRLAPGAPVSEEEWARTLRMSRTPVREALKRLEQQRLVRRVRNHGVFVIGLSIDEFREICEVRALLEGNACRVAAKHASAADLDRFEREFQVLDIAHPTQNDVGKADEIDHAFHTFILEAAGNRQVISIIAHLNDMIMRLRLALTPSRYAESLAEHRAILAALRARDPEAAAAAMQRHMDNVSRSLHRIKMREPLVESETLDASLRPQTGKPLSTAEL